MVLVMMIARTITVTTMRTCRGMKPIIVCALSPRASPQKSVPKTKNFSAQFRKPFKQLKKFPKADSQRLAFTKNSLGLAIFENVSPLSLWIFVEMQSHVFAKTLLNLQKIKNLSQIRNRAKTCELSYSKNSKTTPCMGLNLGLLRDWEKSLTAAFDKLWAITHR